MSSLVGEGQPYNYPAGGGMTQPGVPTPPYGVPRAEMYPPPSAERAATASLDPMEREIDSMLARIGTTTPPSTGHDRPEQVASTYSPDSHANLAIPVSIGPRVHDSTPPAGNRAEELGYQRLDPRPTSERLGIPPEVPDDMRIEAIERICLRIFADMDAREKQIRVNFAPDIQRLEGYIQYLQEQKASHEGPYNQIVEQARRRAEDLRATLERRNQYRKTEIDSLIDKNIRLEIAKLQGDELQQSMYAPDTEARVRAHGQLLHDQWAAQYGRLQIEIGSEEAQTQRNAEAVHGEPITTLTNAIDQRLYELAQRNAELKSAIVANRQDCHVIYEKYFAVLKDFVDLRGRFETLCLQKGVKAARERRAFQKKHGAILDRGSIAALSVRLENSPRQPDSASPSPPASQSGSTASRVVKPALPAGRKTADSGEKVKKPWTRKRVGGWLALGAVAGSAVFAVVEFNKGSSSSNEAQFLPASISQWDPTIDKAVHDTDIAIPVTDSVGHKEYFDPMAGNTLLPKSKFDPILNPGHTYSNAIRAMMMVSSGGDKNYTGQVGPTTADAVKITYGLVPMKTPDAIQAASDMGIGNKFKADGSSDAQTELDTAAGLFVSYAYELEHDPANRAKYADKDHDKAQRAFYDDIYRKWGYSGKTLDKLVQLNMDWNTKIGPSQTASELMSDKTMKQLYTEAEGSK